MNLYGYIKEKFNSGEFVGKGKKQIFAIVGAASAAEKKSVESVLSLLVDGGEIFIKGGRYYPPKELGLIQGTLKGNEKGYAFLIPDERGVSDVFIPNRKLFGAEHKDRVLVKKSAYSEGESDEGEVVKILSRGITVLCGTYYTERHFGFVRPDDKNYYDDVYVPFKNSLNAKSGDKVQLKITSFPKDNNPEGTITRIIGRKYEFAAEENSVILGFGYEEKFPEKVLREANAFSDEIPDNQLIGRLDLTNENIITIDGDDSRDFDDAVCVEKTDRGTYILGVHIADVSEYVTTGS